MPRLAPGRAKHDKPSAHGHFVMKASLLGPALERWQIAPRNGRSRHTGLPKCFAQHLLFPQSAFELQLTPVGILGNLGWRRTPIDDDITIHNFNKISRINNSRDIARQQLNNSIWTREVLASSSQMKTDNLALLGGLMLPRDSAMKIHDQVGLNQR